MAIDITHYLNTITSEEHPIQHAVWVDAWDYGNRLLNKGDLNEAQPLPWHDIAAIISHIKQLQSLVNSDVVTLEVGDFYTAWLHTHPTLLGAMGDKRRLGYALRTMLAEQGAREQLKDIIDALCESYRDKPVVLAIPSPKQWIASAYCAAKGVSTVDISWDDAESASMYVADFLRSFSECAISGLLIRDKIDQGPASDAEVSRYQPILNIAKHYHWQSILDGCPQNYAPNSDTGISFSLREGRLSELSINALTALKLSAQDWSQCPSSVEQGNACFYVCVPVNAIPETVSEKLTQLRTVQEAIHNDAC
ncbi:hypothetical protein A9Q81_00260 [Gammaproteobacteria bacterium 42_54_T18]|nr:hypothetical protein A9Q81_00260 [Gammaproteobacteria bacterium 42_54_T18]